MIPMPRLGHYIEHANSLPGGGTYTHFCDPDELAEFWDLLMRKRILAGLSGGSPFPRKAMLRLVPSGKGSAMDEASVRAMIADWNVQGRKYPYAWLRLERGGEDESPLSKQELDSVCAQLQTNGLPPGAIGDILRRGDEAFILADTREQDALAKAMSALGLASRPAAHFDPESCALDTRYSLSMPRLDAAIARAFHIGREEAKKAVVKGFVAINLRIVRDASRAVEAGDVLHHLLFGAALISGVQKAKAADRHRLLVRFPSSAKILVRG